jgi:glutamate dehydrogenase
MSVAAASRSVPALIDRAADLARQGAGGESTAGFLHLLYKNVPEEDLAGRSAESLVESARDLLDLMAERRPGRARISVAETPEGGTTVRIVNDDMPFLVDSVTAALGALNLSAALVLHPILAVRRDVDGRLERLILDRQDEADLADPIRESVMHVELEGSVDAARRGRIAHDLEHVLADVRAAVIDWAPMLKQVREFADDLGRPGLPVPVGEAAEVAQFLIWLTENNFTFLGYREYSFGDQGLQVMPGRGKGVLRDDSYLVFDGLRNMAQLPPDLQQFQRAPQLLLITKSNRRSTVHRPVPLDTIGIKSFDASGNLVALRFVVGLFTSASYNAPPHAIPILRRKVQRSMERSGFLADSHDGKALRHILDTLPRDELFQIGETELYQMAEGILRLQNRQRVALFARRDPFERFVSCLVYIPRDRYDREVRQRILRILETAFDGTLDGFTVDLDDSALATRLHILVKTTPGQIPDVALGTVEQRLAEAARAWSDGLHEALLAAHGRERGASLFNRYRAAFPPGYADRTDGATAASDIGRIERIESGRPIALILDRREGAAAESFRLKIFHAAEPVTLSTVLPMLENLGFRVVNEIPFETRPEGPVPVVWVQEFELSAEGGAAVDLKQCGPLIEEALPQIWTGSVDNDGFNRLILLAGLSAREVVVLRAYAKFLRQAGATFSQSYMEDTLSAYPTIAEKLVRLFELQFAPEAPDDARLAQSVLLSEAIEAELDEVESLDQDRILRGFLLLITKSLRTNFYQTGSDDRPKPHLSVKLASREIDLLPLPRPLCEIYVYSPRMEGVHLRGGRVARGGIRWSDRREDFRTEILGLMKAQQVKNAVIVPMGSKGGFVVKRAPRPTGDAGADREALMAEVVACYSMLMRGMLDITDTIDGDHVTPPKDVVRRDGDDPYLVVAADKGTATFSDIANGIAGEYGFWLGDAFASGGSVGYDHKVMAITARGAWEAVKRHFRELGTDTQTTDFTCIGVGDMSGDVFGNGMLLSRHIRLVAAFDHRHIFIDPEPDAETGWQERQRLFGLARSSWSDYNPGLISKGGGVFSRAAKAIALTPEIRARFGIGPEMLAPAALIKHLLQQPVDLLWFGGIGTYVKASGESNAEAGDKANDTLRVDAGDLKAKVVGEGANLGVTQRGRIEYALKGGKLNTDAIDNSAGVDTSDHEVNIKIGLGGMIQSGSLTEAERAPFLAAMTDAVASLVLRDNYLQTLALSLAEAEAGQRLDEHARLMRVLEKAGRLDRALEFLPNDETLSERQAARRGLTRPELAVLLAYAKNTTYADLLETDLPDDPALDSELLGYFPEVMVARSAEALEAHRLRREIVATQLANEALNRMGPGFVVEMQARTGRPVPEVLRAFRIARDVFGLAALWQRIEGLDTLVPAACQTRLFLAVQHGAEEAARWFLRSGQKLDIASATSRFRPGVASLAAGLDVLLPEAELQALQDLAARYEAEGVGAALASEVVRLDTLTSGLDITRLDEGRDIDPVALGRLYFALGDALSIPALRARLRALPAATSWQRLAALAMLDDLAALHRDLAARVLDGAADKPVDSRLEAWLAAHAEPLAATRDILAEILRAPDPDLAMLTVGFRQLRSLAAG